MKKLLLILFYFGVYSIAMGQAGNRVFAGAEAVNFGVINFSASSGESWQTDRTATPGYFSAVGSATYTEASDGTDYVDGYVKYYGGNNASASFTFPVGQNTDLRTLSIDNPSATGIYATAWIAGDPTGNQDPTSTGASGGTHDRSGVVSPVIAVSDAGQWDWQDLSADATGKTVRVSIPDQTDFALQENLRLVGWNGTAWVDLSGGNTASGNTENSILSGTMINGISAIGIGSTERALPAIFGKITTIYKNGFLQVNWQTLHEKNCEKYEIEGSLDGTEWKKLGTIASKGKNGNSEVPIDYEFTLGASAAAMAGVSLLVLLLFSTGFGKRKHRWICGIALLMLFAGCSKKLQDVVLRDTSGVKYIRIAQYDFDGGVCYTKVVKVVAK